MESPILISACITLLPSGAVHALDLWGAERPLVELDRLGGALDGQIGVTVR